MPATAVGTAGTPAPVAVASVHLDLRTIPADAELRVDGRSVANPYAADVPRSPFSVGVSVHRAGYRDHSQSIPLDASQRIVIALDRIGAHAADPVRSTSVHTASIVPPHTEPTTSAPAASTSAAPALPSTPHPSDTPSTRPPQPGPPSLGDLQNAI
jgi:hypothetical protein